MSTTKPILTTIDAFPGSGKTNYFNSQASENVLGSSNRKFVLVYAAPTRALCKEVYFAILKKLNPSFVGEADLSSIDPKILSRIHQVWHNDESERDHSLDRLFNKTAPKIRIIDSLNDLLGTCEEPDVAIAAKPGHVIITTHESFMKVRNVPTLHPTWVFFDEARQCLGVKDTIHIPKAISADYLSMFKPRRLENSNEDDTDVRHVYKLTTLPNLPEVKALIEPYMNKVSLKKKFQRGPIDLYQIFKTIDKDRVSLFILAKEEAFSRTSKGSQDNYSISVYPFNKPTGLFHNYARVTVMSAFFKDSQMYHALKGNYQVYSLLRPSKDETDVPDWITIARNDNLIKTTKGRDRQLRTKMGRRLRIVPLLTSNWDSEDSLHHSISVDRKDISSKDRLTKETLRSGMLVSPKVATKVQTFIDDIHLPINSWKVIELVWLHWFIFIRTEPLNKQPVLSTKDQSAYKLRWRAMYGQDYDNVIPKIFNWLEPFMFDKKSNEILFPSWVLTRRAKKAAKLIGAESPLLIYNSAASAPLPFMPTKLKDANSFVWNKSLVSDTTAKLRKRFSKFFIIPESLKLNGLNLWIKNNHLVHLAALNPSLETISVFKKLLPKYDVEYDFILENLVQTLYRTSLREPTLKDSHLVYLYVVRASLARWLTDKIQLNFQLHIFDDKDFPPLVELRFNSKVALHLKKARISFTKTKYDKETAAALRKVRSKLFYYTNISTLKQLTKKQLSAKALLEKQLKKLQANRLGV